MISFGLLSSFSIFHCNGGQPFRNSISCIIFSPKSRPHIDLIVSRGPSYGPLTRKQTLAKGTQSHLDGGPLRGKGNVHLFVQDDRQLYEILIIEMVLRKLHIELLFPAHVRAIPWAVGKRTMPCLLATIECIMKPRRTISSGSTTL